MSDVDTLAECLERLTRRHGHLVLELSFHEAVTLVAQVQLALRHPGNTGHGAAEARRMADALIDILAKGEPELGRLLRLGFDPAHDIRVAGG